MCPSADLVKTQAVTTRYRAMEPTWKIEIGWGQKGKRNHLAMSNPHLPSKHPGGTVKLFSHDFVLNLRMLDALKVLGQIVA